MKIDPDRLMTASLKSVPWGESVARILAAALESVEPRRAVARFLRRTGSQLLIEGRAYDLSRYKRVFVAGAGKAGLPMAKAACQVLGDSLTRGIVIVKEGYAQSDEAESGPFQGLSSAGSRAFSRIELIEAGHPAPDLRGQEGTQKILETMREANREDLVLCLISGGGSALMTAPAGEVTLADLQELTGLLLKSGATINEINTLRKHLDNVKGGKLAQAAQPAAVASLILSDVVGDPLDVIASGPTVPDSTTYAQAYGVLEHYNLTSKTPGSILAHLKKGMRGDLPETPKEYDPLFARVQNVIVASNFQAANAALEAARLEGFHTLLLTTYMQGEARQAGRMLAAIARQLDPNGDPVRRPACLVSGGETTVTVRGKGLGGRNQEMALAAVREMAGLRDIALVTLATDGGDGPTDAAGAVVTGQTLTRAAMLGLDPKDFLERNDSYHFFNSLDDLLRPGPTQTNVNDLTFVFAF